MGIKSLIDLWRHRYNKYSHIMKARLSGKKLAANLLRAKKARSRKELIAVVRTEHFGDIVAVEPLSRKIRNRHPDAHIVWFVKPVFKELVEVNPHIDEVIPELCVTQRQHILNSRSEEHTSELQSRE